jgi:hypothetical protein
MRLAARTIIPLLRRGPGYVQMFLPYYCRGRDSGVDDGKDKEDFSDYFVPTHFRGIA